jgi:L-amino acid N-acyltransferase YncA
LQRPGPCRGVVFSGLIPAPADQLSQCRPRESGDPASQSDCCSAYAGPYRARPAYRFTIEDSVYIAPEAQRRGLGHLLLLDRLISESEVRGYRQMVAVIGDSAQLASITLHAAAGFRPVGTLEAVGHKLGRWLDSVLMQRPLGPGATTGP